MVQATGNRNPEPAGSSSETTKTALRTGVVLLAVPLLLSGCLFNRVMEVKQQACAFDDNFELQFSDRPAIVLKRPVLLQEDIVWLAGIEPTRTTAVLDGLMVTFEAEEDVARPNRENDLAIDFVFGRFNDQYRLREIRLDPKASLFFNESYLDRKTVHQAADDVCNTRLGFAMTGMDMDLTADEVAMLPTRPEVLQLVGPPHGIAADGTGWEYRYRLKGQDKGDPVARFTIWFDDENERPLRFESSYARYQASADLEAMKISMNIKL